MTKKIIIFGASGLIGSELVNALQVNSQLTLVSRKPQKLQQRFPKHCCINWHEVNADLLAEHNAVINLCGENIGAGRWSEARKQAIINSRVNTTQQIATWCSTLKERAPVVLNASAIGIYGLANNVSEQNTEHYDEDSELPEKPTDFLADVGKQWEQAAAIAKDNGVTVISLRFAVVLARSGGALAKLLPSFKFGMGAVLGSGLQPLSWVAIDDVVAAIMFLLDHPDASGPYNIVGGVTSQREFADTLAQVLRRPRLLKLPAELLKPFFGQMADELLLNGQYVVSKRLISLGFQFAHTDLASAIRQIL